VSHHTLITSEKVLDRRVKTSDFAVSNKYMYLEIELKQKSLGNLGVDFEIIPTNTIPHSVIILTVTILPMKVLLPTG
jgi:hypothetical protein